MLWIRCLGKFAVPASASVPASMSMAPDNTYLMVGCTDGHMLRYNISRQTMLALEDRSKDEKQPMQTLRPNILYPDGDEWHDGYIDDIYVLGQNSAEAKHKLDGCIGEYDDNIWYACKYQCVLIICHSIERHWRLRNNSVESRDKYTGRCRYLIIIWMAGFRWLLGNEIQSYRAKWQVSMVHVWFEPC